MAHFAKIEDGIVTAVLVVPDAREADGEAYLNSLGLVGSWIQTSYNSHGGVHYGADGEPDGRPHLRYNYAGVGFTYDADADAFVPPQPPDQAGGVWTLNPTTMLWDWMPDGDG